MLNYKYHQYQVQQKLVKNQIIYLFFKNFQNSLNIFKYVFVNHSCIYVPVNCLI